MTTIIPLAGAVLCEDCQMITQATQSVCLACGSKAIYSLQAMLEKGYRVVRLTGIERERLEATAHEEFRVRVEEQNKRYEAAIAALSAASKEEQGGWTICPNCKAGFDPTPPDSRKER